MMRRIPAALLAACLLAPGIAPAADGDAAALFSRPVVLNGTLGDAKIQAHLRPKAAIDEGIEGEYFIFGQSQKILLAGELEGEDVVLEESENGTDVSGQWEGKRQGDTIQGKWLSADGAVSKPFALKIMATDAAPKSRPAPAKPARAPQ
jgi:hypothetical protein